MDVSPPGIVEYMPKQYKLSVGGSGNSQFKADASLPKQTTLRDVAMTELVGSRSDEPRLAI